MTEGVSRHLPVVAVGGLGLASAVYGRAAVGVALAWSAQRSDAPGNQLPVVDGDIALQLGTILGAICIGELADAYGRRLALCIAAILVLLGEIGCLVASVVLSASSDQPGTGSELGALQVMQAIFHFILGFGVGGEYPVAAAYVVEVASADVSQSARRLARLYIYQCVGGAVALLLALCFASQASSTFCCQVMFTIGIMLALASLLTRLRFASETRLFAEQLENDSPARQAGIPLLWKSSRLLWRPVCGTALAWFLFGFVACGLDSSADVLPAGSNTAQTEIGRAALAIVFSLPGYIAVVVLTRCRRRGCQLVSFAAMALGFVVFAALKQIPHAEAMLPPLYGMLRMVASGGASATVLFIPAEIFPTCVRASGIGIATASGALGSTIGVFVVWLLGPPSAGVEASSSWAVGGICSLICIAGAVVTAKLTPKYDGQTLQMVARLKPGKDARDVTIEALQNGAQFRQCPVCEVMVERSGGCNVITCSNCQENWCFACGAGQGVCRPWACSSIEGSDSSLEKLPELLWPGVARDMSLPLVETSRNE